MEAAISLSSPSMVSSQAAMSSSMVSYSRCSLKVNLVLARFGVASFSVVSDFEVSAADFPLEAGMFFVEPGSDFIEFANVPYPDNSRYSFLQTV